MIDANTLAGTKVMQSKYCPLIEGAEREYTTVTMPCCSGGGCFGRVVIVRGDGDHDLLRFPVEWLDEKEDKRSAT